MLQFKVHCLIIKIWYFIRYNNKAIIYFKLSESFPGGSDGKASAHNVGDPGSIHGLGRSR